MAELSTCLDCGGAVPLGAAACPHCGAIDYLGLPCAVCQQPIAPSAVVYLPQLQRFFHEDCLAQVQLAPRPCGSCGALALDASLEHCPNCGAPLDHQACKFCGHAFAPELTGCEDWIHKVERDGLLIYEDIARRGEAHRICAEARGGFARQDLYQDLFEALKVGDWRSADRETDRLVRYFAAQCSFLELPTAELQQIDELWVTYSRGQFGWSIQAALWTELGGQPGEWDSEVYEQLADYVGWQVTLFDPDAAAQDDWQRLALWWQRFRGTAPDRVVELIPYNSLIFDLSAPVGHLPYPGAETGRNFAAGRSRQDSWDVPYLALHWPPADWSAIEEDRFMDDDPEDSLRLPADDVPDDDAPDDFDDLPDAAAEIARDRDVKP